MFLVYQPCQVVKRQKKKKIFRGHLCVRAVLCTLRMRTDMVLETPHEETDNSATGWEKLERYYRVNRK
jgi:hypothetical protein